jgi:hypothetical protein
LLTSGAGSGCDHQMMPSMAKRNAGWSQGILQLNWAQEAEQPPCCFHTGVKLVCSAKMFRRLRRMSITNVVLVMLMIMLATRSEANCFAAEPQPVTQSQMMENCADMETSLIGPQDSAPTHHSDEQQAGMCHLGCPVLLKAADAHHYQVALHLFEYLRELEPLAVGINAVPQTPPPRFG